MPGHTVLFDASVLYAAPIRDLLLELSLSDLFRAKWTERTNDEWISHLLINRHVLAAAIKGHAEVIVTFNLADFPAAMLALYGIEARHPDAFLSALLEIDRAEVGAAAHRVRARLRQPPLDVTAYLAVLERCGLSATAASLRAMQALL